MDFHALMKKKLGGKYDQPKFTDDNRAREDTVADDKAIEAAEVRDIEEEGELTPPPKRPQLDITFLWNNYCPLGLNDVICRILVFDHFEVGAIFIFI